MIMNEEGRNSISEENPNGNEAIESTIGRDDGIENISNMSKSISRKSSIIEGSTRASSGASRRVSIKLTEEELAASNGRRASNAANSSGSTSRPASNTSKRSSIYPQLDDELLHEEPVEEDLETSNDTTLNYPISRGISLIDQRAFSLSKMISEIELEGEIQQQSGDVLFSPPPELSTYGHIVTAVVTAREDDEAPLTTFAEEFDKLFHESLEDPNYNSEQNPTKLQVQQNVAISPAQQIELGHLDLGLTPGEMTPKGDFAGNRSQSHLNDLVNASKELLASATNRRETQFLDTVFDEEEEDGSEEQTLTLEDEIKKREEFMERIRACLETKDRLKSYNVILQHKLADFYKKKKQSDDSMKGMPAEVEEAAAANLGANNNQNNNLQLNDQEGHYKKLLKNMGSLYKEYDIVEENNKATIEDMKLKVEARMEEVKKKQFDFARYRTSVASQAENARTGKHIAPSVIEQKESIDAQKSEEVFDVHLEHLKLRNKLKRQEMLLKQKEELAEGLHLIDFEQLKIENQTYSEKIEERNEELSKLKSKLNNVVQVLTHVKEKLQCKQTESSELTSELDILDEEVRKYRDKLPSQKHRLLVLKNKIIDMKEKGGLTGNEVLLKDFELKFNSRDRLNEKAEALEKEYDRIMRETASIKNKLEKQRALLS